MKYTTKNILRFWKKVDKKSDEECWNWLGACGNYGHLTVQNKQISSHRFSYLINVGDIPDGMFICHKCDNHFCVNPNHLFIGTQKDNMQDKINKNRGADLAGTSNGKHKLTDNEVMEIRNSSLSNRKLAKLYNVSYSLIGGIKRKERWKHL
jgi:hypothetical protein